MPARVVQIGTSASRTPPPDEPQSGWAADLVRNKSGQCVCCHANLALIFKHDEKVRGLFALDEFANRVMLTRDPPWAKRGREWIETDIAALSVWLGQLRTYSMNCKSTLVAEVVAMIATENAFHPVRDYLTGLKWDGTPRVAELLPDYFGSADSGYTRRVGMIFMLSAAARILRPGCKVDTMLVIEGTQGIGKTSAVQTLFGGDKWYMDAQRSVSDKDFFQELVGKWGVEVGEMTSFTKADHNKLKQTLSATSDTYRPSYGRYARTFPRQCVFVGTTNEDNYLRDPTGARRYLPVRASGLDVDALRADRDQLWAEAVSRVRAGEEWWTLPPDAAKEQADRFDEDAWQDNVCVWTDEIGARERYPATVDAEVVDALEVRRVRSCTTAEILKYALGVETARQGKVEQMRVAAIMKHRGWTRRRFRRGDERAWFWVRPGYPA